MPTRTTTCLTALALCAATGATAETLNPIDVADMSRGEFVDTYLSHYTSQLEWTREAFARVGDGYEEFVDADAPLSDLERAVPGCLYDAADSPEAKQQLGMQLAVAQMMGEKVRADADIDYVDVVYGGLADEIEGYEPTQGMATMMQACKAPQAAMQRMSFTQDTWKMIQSEAVERGYVDP